MANNLYRYTITITYPYENDNYPIDSTNIKHLVIDYDYAKNNMPIILLTAMIDKNILDDMIENSKNKTMILRVCKYLKDSEFSIKDDYIYEELNYFLPDDLNTSKDLDYSGATAKSQDIYKKITIGLMSKKLIDNNKQKINTVFKDTSLINIILKYTSHMNMLIEPMDNTKINKLIVPPIETVTNFIKYLDLNYSLYSTPYRLFYDFDKTYLLSSTGKNVPASGEKINSIIINVNKSNTLESKQEGMEIDRKLKAYAIQLSTSDLKYSEDKATDVSYNKIIGIDSQGNTKEVDLDLGNKKTSTNIRIERMTNDNLDYIDAIKANIVNSSINISFTKTELDTTVLTLNRHFIIKNYSKLGYKDGTFILNGKKEIYTPDNGNFILTTILNLKKAIIES